VRGAYPLEVFGVDVAAWPFAKVRYGAIVAGAPHVTLHGWNAAPASTLA
jgi:hypothetical protein